jgi:hypothetical protein
MGELLPAGLVYLRLTVRPGYWMKKSRVWKMMMDGELSEWLYKGVVDIEKGKLSFELL